MKPLKLTMCSFGPYKDEVQIDFEKIGNSRNIFNNWRYRKSEKQRFLMQLYLLYMEKLAVQIETLAYSGAIFQKMILKLLLSLNFQIKEKYIKLEEIQLMKKIKNLKKEQQLKQVMLL